MVGPVGKGIKLPGKHGGKKAVFGGKLVFVAPGIDKAKTSQYYTQDEHNNKRKREQHLGKQSLFQRAFLSLRLI
jgi:hypothetical protein